jgi:hypothetical protein
MAFPPMTSSWATPEILVRKNQNLTILPVTKPNYMEDEFQSNVQTSWGGKLQLQTTEIEVSSNQLYIMCYVDCYFRHL